ncbi:FadR family transcriptional regulator [Mesorhizobium composti]|uniref:FadR family transcriptional regulator n=1 Tax=Ollibium composti TaxID=2675109 RepID=A0ABY2Q1S4_9HYPH|nr:FadR family transcriptional regulator [Mesorhizobium composti]
MARSSTGSAAATNSAPNPIEACRRRGLIGGGTTFSIPGCLRRWCCVKSLPLVLLLDQWEVDLARTSAVQSVVSTLRSEIPENYKPGDLLQNERDIAERLDVSRNTVREALIHLEAFGIIEKTQRGPRVCAPNIGAVFHVMDQYFDRSPKTCQDLLDFRRIIDLGLLPQALENATEDDLALLEKHVSRMERALTAREAAEADYAFHNEIVRVADNRVAMTLYTVLTHTLIFYMEIGKNSRENSERTIEDHRAIVAALRSRNLPDALRALSNHYEYSEQAVRAVLTRSATAAETRDMAS